MITTARLLVSVVAVVACGSCARGASNRAPTPAGSARVAVRLDSLTEAHRRHQHVPGIAVAIATLSNGSEVDASAGFADVANGVPVTRNTRFRIYSVSKVFAAVLVHQ